MSAKHAATKAMQAGAAIGGVPVGAEFGATVKFGKTAGDYAKHRHGFPLQMFHDLQSKWGIGASGQRILDLGTGTGTMSRGLAAMGAQVVGTDPEAPMLEQAKALDQAADPPLPVLPVYEVASAEDLSAFKDGEFDFVSAGQCFHWFDLDRAFPEIKRVLRPGGRVVICHFDWLPYQGNVVDGTEKLIEKHNPKWSMGGGNGFYPRWAMEAGSRGWKDIETLSWTHDAPYTLESWMGRIRASAGVGATLSQEAVEAFDKEHLTMLSEKLGSSEPSTPCPIPHRVWMMVASPPA